ncbi:MAG TPA: hypothetical protein VFX59_04740 [Polyangiales bacterium]|nr:hypothetical protein [Polyangiales bacterium]
MPHLISRKKRIYPVGETFAEYLAKYDRGIRLPVRYDHLLRYEQAIPLYDKAGRDTLWVSVLYSAQEHGEVREGLLQIYAQMKGSGDTEVFEHLIVDRIDLCTYGNTQPFRVRILNTLNDNFDYFYVKRADASRLYGLELEQILSPNNISFLYDRDTLVEEHIAGIPGNMFIKSYLSDRHLDEVRLAKEFVKFNERCFVRLLGDMHSANFVIDITPDFEETSYRIRAIDFDQQSYEPKRQVYLPQYFKQNNPIIFLGVKCMSRETVRQYQIEERSLIRRRVKSAYDRLDDILSVMARDEIAPKENVKQLGQELSEHYGSSAFSSCESMGELVVEQLSRLELQHTGL